MKNHQQNHSRLIEDKPGITVEFECRFQQKNCRKKVSKEQNVHDNQPSNPVLHIPQTAKLLVLAHHYQRIIDDNVVKDYAEIARLTGTSRARISQIISLTFLAPKIQQEILFLPPVKPLPLHVKERNLRKVLKTIIWKEQKEIWNSERIG